MRWKVATVPVLYSMLIATSAQAVTFHAVYMNSWSGCDESQSSLDYSDDQINQFTSNMTSKGHTCAGSWYNQDAYGSDIGEDRDIGGMDCWWSDDADAWVFSGHGSAPTGDDGYQRFEVPFCHKGASSFVGTSRANSRDHMRLGEQSSYYSTPYSGHNRWMLWATCYSVHTYPDQQWASNLAEGTEYIMGYRGTSSDSEFTDEVLSDWVNDAFQTTVYTFKSSWFSAAEDWWENDTAEVISGGYNNTDATWRRDNYARTTPRRSAGVYWNYYAWSWHQG